MGPKLSLEEERPRRGGGSALLRVCGSSLCPAVPTGHCSQLGGPHGKSKFDHHICQADAGREANVTPFPGVLIEKEKAQSPEMRALPLEVRQGWPAGKVTALEPALLLIASQPLPSVGAQQRLLERSLPPPGPALSTHSPREGRLLHPLPDTARSYILFLIHFY